MYLSKIVKTILYIYKNIYSNICIMPNGYDDSDINEIHTTTDIELDSAAELIQQTSIAYLNKKNSNKNLKLLKNKIHDALFEEKESIPEGIYIKLMNILKD